MALSERADLRAARLAESASAARLKLAEARRTPDVAAVARFSRSKQIVDLPERIGGVALDRDDELTFGVQLGIPVFNRN
ncbi:TolC family protein, partial [Escherichia coli]|nr:TolC family protein [Escherichia coli]